MISTRHRRVTIYVAWIVVFAAAFGAGGYTLGFFVDTDDLGTLTDPNELVAGNNFDGGGTFGNGGNFGNAGNADLEFDAPPVDLFSKWVWNQLLALA